MVKDINTIILHNVPHYLCGQGDHIKKQETITHQVDTDVYHAPTCGFIEWICPKCGEIVDLEKLTGITYEDCSNKELIRQIIEAIK